MKKFTILMMACLAALIGQAQVTPPAGNTPLLYTFSGHDTYIDQDKTAEVFVVFNGMDVYFQGLSVDYMPSGWVKGTLDADGMVTVPATYMGQFDFWGDTYDVYDGYSKEPMHTLWLCNVTHFVCGHHPRTIGILRVA